jgi:hypothetical protein
MKHIFLSCFILSLCFYGCNSNKGNTEKLDMNRLISENSQTTELEISEESLNSIIQSLPSPLEIASLIKGSGVPFNEGLLNKVESQKNFTTDFEKSLAMGLFSGNLGYINVYEKSYLAIKYLSAIKNLADDLNIGQFFDFETIKRLSENSDKIDSLIYMSTVNFEKMDAFLRSQKRSNLSVLIVTGTWMESLYLATQVVKTKPNDELVERIAEQKMILDQVLLILSAYKSDPFFSDMLDNMSVLKTEFDKVTFTYVYQEPTTKEVNGRLVIVDNSTTEVTISDEQLAQITQAIEEIRSNIINNTNN